MHKDLSSANFPKGMGEGMALKGRISSGGEWDDWGNIKAPPAAEPAHSPPTAFDN
jgi:hypothetical protein